MIYIFVKMIKFYRISKNMIEKEQINNYIIYIYIFYYINIRI